MGTNYVDKLTSPRNKLEQLQGIIAFYLNDKEIEHLKFLPDCVKEVAFRMFKESECFGYRSSVIRSALKELETKGEIDYDTQMYRME